MDVTMLMVRSGHRDVRSLTNYTKPSIETVPPVRGRPRNRPQHLDRHSGQPPVTAPATPVPASSTPLHA